MASDKGLPELFKQIFQWLAKPTKKQSVGLVGLALILISLVIAFRWYTSPDGKGSTSSNESHVTTTNTNSNTSGSGSINVIGDRNIIGFEPSPVAQEPDPFDNSPPPPVPENFPSFSSSGLAALTDDDRKSPYYAESDIVVVNDTERDITLACSHLRKDPGEEAASEYVHRQVGDVHPGEQRTVRQKKFGGPVCLSIYTGKRWYSTDKWFDMGIAKSRTVKVMGSAKDGFSAKVDIEK